MRRMILVRLPVLALALVALVAALGLSACGADDATPAGCLCEAGRAGETLWCEACGTGWIDGKPAPDKAAVDLALSRLVEERAKARGLGGSEVDRIIGDIAAGVVKRGPACRCEACAKGEAHPEGTDHVHEALAGADAAGTDEAGQDGSAPDAEQP